MAFFGLTALGSNSSLRSAQLATIGATLFTDAEFSLVFNSRTAGELAVSQLTEVLDEVYGFEPLPEEVALFRAALEREGGSSVDLAGFLAAVQQVRDVASALEKNAKTYASFQELNDDRRKHRRGKCGPMEIFKAPQTANQQFGWHLENVTLVRYPKKACAETKFADVLVKSGWM